MGTRIEYTSEFLKSFNAQFAIAIGLQASLAGFAIFGFIESAKVEANVVVTQENAEWLRYCSFGAMVCALYVAIGLVHLCRIRKAISETLFLTEEGVVLSHGFVLRWDKMKIDTLPFLFYNYRYPMRFFVRMSLEKKACYISYHMMSAEARCFLANRCNMLGLNIEEWEKQSEMPNRMSE